MSRKKIAIVLGVLSGLWLAMPSFTQFNTGNFFYDLGSQSVHVASAWIIFGVIVLLSKIKNRSKNKQAKQLV